MTNYGRLVVRDYNPAEHAVLFDTLQTPDDIAYDTHQNHRTY